MSKTELKWAIRGFLIGILVAEIVVWQLQSYWAIMPVREKVALICHPVWDRESYCYRPSQRIPWGFGYEREAL